MNVQLVIERGGRRKVLTLRKREAVLGRCKGNTVRIPSSEVSRQHCRLLQENGLVKLEDLGSVNGTFLNGRRIRGAEVVWPGDNLEVGPVTFIVEYEMSPEALERIRGKRSERDVLEALADGDVLETIEDGEILELDEDPPVLEEVEEEPGVISIPSLVEDGEDIPVDFDLEAPTWQMPEGGELRDILGQLEDESPPTRQTPKKRR